MKFCIINGMVTPGSRLGPYEILSRVGAGGMGEVYRARDTRLDRVVALKVLLEPITSGDHLRQRFDREARAISSLSHPAICSLFDVGHHDSTDYLVMEFLEGDTLDKIIAKGALPLETVLQYSIQIADALDAAHRCHIIHRDLKPGNIMVTKTGLKLLDFGLAKLTAPALSLSMEETSERLPLSSLTAEGSLLGTLPYMAPELFEGREADERTDLYAFGMILYEMITGSYAFPAKNQAGLIAAILKEEPKDVALLRPGTPPALQRLVKRCLEKNPENRWQSARDLALELRAMNSTTPVERPYAAPTSKSSSLLWGLVALLSIICFILGAVILRSREKASMNSDTVSFYVDPPAGSEFTDTVSVSPNNKYLAFVALDSHSHSQLFVRPLNSLELRVVPESDGAAFPFWSPDSSSVAYFADQVLRRFDLASGAVTTLCDAPDPRGGSWNQYGDIIFAAEAGGSLYRVLANGGSPQSLRTVQQEEKSQRFPNFLPDGDHYLFYVLHVTPEEAGLYLASLHSKDMVRVSDALSSAQYSPSGDLVFNSEGVLVRQHFDLKSFKLTGPAKRISDKSWWSGWLPGESGFAVNSSGTLAFRTGGLQRQQLRWLDRSGKDLGPAAPPGAYYEPALSLDQRRVLVSGVDSKTGNNDIWMIELSSGTISRLTFEPTWQVTPVWSPDSQHFVYGSFPAGLFGLGDLSGSTSPQVLLQNGVFKIAEQWSQDGKYLIYEALDLAQNKADIWALPFFGERKPFVVLNTAANETDSRLSADGQWLTYVSNETGQPEVYVRRFPVSTEKWRISTSGGARPYWRNDGRELFYKSPDNRIMSVNITYESGGLQASVPTPLFFLNLPPTPETRNQYCVTPDGQRFLVNLSSPENAAAPVAVILNWAQSNPGSAQGTEQP